ncbi:hypothetical protein NL108_001223 [Boleophthalmus pectinirostris]|nr:hypothetical protein NL108_001223 [Boleophthalmus pectinirostris]
MHVATDSTTPGDCSLKNKQVDSVLVLLSDHPTASFNSVCQEKSFNRHRLLKGHYVTFLVEVLTPSCFHKHLIASPGMFGIKLMRHATTSPDEDTDHTLSVEEPSHSQQEYRYLKHTEKMWKSVICFSPWTCYCRV